MTDVILVALVAVIMFVLGMTYAVHGGHGFWICA